jgi:hypothetical protein
MHGPPQVMWADMCVNPSDRCVYPSDKFVKPADKRVNPLRTTICSTTSEQAMRHKKSVRKFMEVFKRCVSTSDACLQAMRCNKSVHELKDVHTGHPLEVFKRCVSTSKKSAHKLMEVFKRCVSRKRSLRGEISRPLNTLARGSSSLIPPGNNSGEGM